MLDKFLNHPLLPPVQDQRRKPVLPLPLHKVFPRSSRSILHLQANTPNMRPRKLLLLAHRVTGTNSRSIQLFQANTPNLRPRRLLLMALKVVGTSSRSNQHLWTDTPNLRVRRLLPLAHRAVSTISQRKDLQPLGGPQHKKGCRLRVNDFRLLLLMPRQGRTELFRRLLREREFIVSL